MGQYLIDNNTISNFFSGLFSEKGIDFIAEVIDQTPVISVSDAGFRNIQGLEIIDPNSL